MGIGRVVSHLIRAVALLARDERIPRPLRLLAAVGLAPIPGPFDEVLLLLLAPVLFGFYPGPLKDSWERTARGADVVRRPAD